VSEFEIEAVGEGVRRVGAEDEGFITEFGTA
jgi:hypothetical protein